MKKKILLSALLSLAVFIGTISTVSAITCTNNFPTSLNNYTAGACIPSAWANALESTIGITGSSVNTSLTYIINHLPVANIVGLGSIATHPTSDFLPSSTAYVSSFNGATGTTSFSFAVTSTNSFISTTNNTTSSALTFSSSSLGLSNAAQMTLPVSVANGGTGTSTAPSNGQYYGASSSIPMWKSFIAGTNVTINNGPTSTVISAVLTSSTAAGSPTQIQYNEGGLFAGTSTLTFVSSTETLSVNNLSLSNVSGTFLSTTQIPTGTLLAFNNGKWQSGLAENFFSATNSTGGTGKTNVATWTIPFPSGVQSFYQIFINYNFSPSGGQASTTISINGTPYLTCAPGGTPVQQALDLKIWNQNSTSSEMTSYIESGSCTATGFSANAFNNSASTTITFGSGNNNGTWTATVSSSVYMIQ